MALTGSTIASTYLKLLRINTDTMGADATASYIQDSADTDSALSISTTRVGIGTAAPEAPLMITGSNVGDKNNPIIASYTPALLIDSSTTNDDTQNAIAFVKNFSGDKYIGASIVAESNYADASGVGVDIAFLTNRNDETDGGLQEAMRISQAGNVTVSTGDLIFGTAGKGICLGVTSNTDANTLDDYEEGYFTGALTCGTSGTITVNSSYDQLAYTKIGRVVHVQGFLTTASVSTPVGQVALTGLPFTSANLTEVAGKSAVSATVNGLASGNAADVVGEISEGQTKIDLYFGDASSWVSDVAESWQTGTDIRISATYFAA